MESSQWEVVSKSRKHRNLEKKVELHAEKKRIAALEPKLEEILPSKQYRKMVSCGEVRKYNVSPTKSSTSISSSEKSRSPKKTAKKEQDGKRSSQDSSKKPKNIEGALRSITIEDFHNQLEILKQLYPGSELLWLRGIAMYLNTILPFDCDPTFSGKSINYPSNLLSNELTNAIIKFLESMGETNLTYFFYMLLTNMCIDLAKSSPTVGYKLLLQLIGRNWPKICSNDMAKTALLRVSYENRSNICLSIFWAVAQGGYQELIEGIRVWQNLMLTNLELRSYSKFVVEYLEKILNTAVKQTLPLDQQTFFDMYNILRKQYIGIPKELQESLKRSSALFLQKYISYSTKHANIFLQLFRDINYTNEDTIGLEGCISCLLKGDDSFKVWKMNFKKQIIPSTLVLQKIVMDWSNIGSALLKSKSYENFLKEADILIEELELSKKKVPSLKALIESVRGAQQAAAQHKKKQNNSDCKKCGCCKWVLGSIFLIALIAGALTYDTNVNGRGVFAASATGKALKNAGLLPHVEKAWYTTMSAGARGYKWAEVNVPPYAKPAGKLACDLYKIGRNAVCNGYGIASNFVSSKLPVAANFLEQYIPGLPKKIESVWVTVKGVSIQLYESSAAFFQTQVLVGRLSPENLRKALNETQNVAWEYYYIFHKKVDTYAKLK